MNKLYAIAMLAALLTSCHRHSLKDEILELAADKTIDEKDFKKIAQYVSANASYQKYRDPKALFGYISKVVSTAKHTVNVWNPVPPARISAYRVQVYLENSASMDGYMTGTDLKNGVYELLDNLQHHAAGMQLNYINNRIIPIHSKATAAANKQFILQLSQKSFKASGGERATSDIAEVISSVLKRTNSQTLSVLVSDFVFSPGSGVEAGSYLNIQRISIENDIRDQLKRMDLVIAVYQMGAAFSGAYFDHNNQPIALHAERPYYIWLIGTETQVKSLLAAQVIREANARLQQRVVFKNTRKPENWEYKILHSGMVGTFKTGDLKNEINEAEARNGVFAFSIAVNLADNVRGGGYFLDAGRYQLSDPTYRVSPRLLTAAEKLRADLKGYTHILTFKTQQLRTNTLVVNILSGLPSWIRASNSGDDTRIAADQQEQSRTFGLSALMAGLDGGFNAYPNPDDNLISTLKIIINK